jgi:hypothetical protein
MKQRARMFLAAAAVTAAGLTATGFPVVLASKHWS